MLLVTKNIINVYNLIFTFNFFPYKDYFIFCIMNHLNILKYQINQFSHNFSKPNVKLKYNYINTNSWFHIQQHNKTLFNKQHINVIKDDLDNDGFFTRKIRLILEDWQQNIMLKWMDAYTHMFNITTKYFKKCRFNNIYPSLNITNLKEILKRKKNKIYKKSKINVNNKDIFVDRHLLDYAINDAKNRYKSCLTNFNNGNIKHFRLRYLRLNKNNKIIKVEKSAFTNDCFYKRTFKKIKLDTTHNINFKKELVTTSIIQYLKDKNQFMLLIKYRQHKTKNHKKDIISLDPGIRMPFTGYSNKDIVNIGPNINKHIRNKLNKIDCIMASDLKESCKKELRQMIYNKIKNRIVDYHWKTIKFLTSEYKYVVIGNLSTKAIGERNMNEMTKRIANLLNLFKFKERLKYKCSVTGTKFKEEDESYTSKCCSNCGYVNKNLGSAKVYDCPICRIKIGRDVNGALNILLKSAI